MNESDLKLINSAAKVRKNAKALYSNFKVGASLIDDNGNIFTGVNVECSSYGLTICAERVALTKALSEGYNNFKQLAIVTDSVKLTAPCGACRQLLYDYAPNLEIILSNGETKIKKFKLSELLPEPFGRESL